MKKVVIKDNLISLEVFEQINIFRTQEIKSNYNIRLC